MSGRVEVDGPRRWIAAAPFGRTQRVCVSPSGRWMLLAEFDRTVSQPDDAVVSLYEVASGRLVWSRAFSAPMGDPAFVDDDRWLVLHGASRVVSLRTVADGAVIGERALGGASMLNETIQLSRDRRRVLLRYWDHGGSPWGSAPASVLDLDDLSIVARITPRTWASAFEVKEMIGFELDSTGIRVLVTSYEPQTPGWISRPLVVDLARATVTQGAQPIESFECVWMDDGSFGGSQLEATETSVAWVAHDANGALRRRITLPAHGAIRPRWFADGTLVVGVSDGSPLQVFDLAREEAQTFEPWLRAQPRLARCGWDVVLEEAVPRRASWCCMGWRATARCCL